MDTPTFPPALIAMFDGYSDARLRQEIGAAMDRLTDAEPHESRSREAAAVADCARTHIAAMSHLYAQRTGRLPVRDIMGRMAFRDRVLR